MRKRYCTIHGTAQFDDAPCTRCRPSQAKQYANIVLVSTTQMARSRTGEPMLGIGEVISEHVVDTPENIALKRGALELLHAARSSIY